MSNKNFTEREICREISSDIGASYEEVLIIVRSFLSYLRWVIEKSGFETMTLPYFGKFKVNHKRVQIVSSRKISKHLGVHKFYT